MTDDGRGVVDALVDRDDFPTLRDARYLNQASLGLIGRPATEAMHRYLDDVARHGNLHLTDEQEAASLDTLRRAAGTLLGARAERVAIVSGASELLGQAPSLMRPPRGSSVVLVETDFPAVTRPWLELADDGRCRVRFVADDPTTDLTDALIGAVDESTAVVAVGWVQYATGTTVDVPRLRAAADAVGAHLLVDVTQGAGVLPVAADAWDADLVVSSGYKWLGGHGGVGLGVIGHRLQGRSPALAGWMGAPDPFDFDATRLDWAVDARRFTASTMSYVSVAGLTASLDQLLSIGVEAISAHAGQLARRLVAMVAPLGWTPYRSLTDPAASPHLVSLAPTAAADPGAAQRLVRGGVVCSGRGGRLRVSLAHYNADEDIDALATVLGAP